MQINYDLQDSILAAIKTALKPSVSLVDEIAECLSISNDSAYRRIRGETLFDIGDLEKLTKKYHLSLDSFFGLKKSTVSFHVQSINLTDFTLIDYFKSLEKNLSALISEDHKHLFFSARDIPIFHLFQLPNLSSFKIFIWLKYYLNHPLLSNVMFDLSNIPEIVNEFSVLSKRIWSIYLKIPSTEIWTLETPNITLRQLEFSFQAGIVNIETCEHLFAEYTSLLNHIQNQAKQGNKYTINSNATLEGAEYNMYFNEISIGDNSGLFIMGSKKMAYNTYGNLNFMSTTDEAYTNYIEHHFQTTMKNSTLISSSAEKIRSNFFNVLFRKVEMVKGKILDSTPLY